MEKKTLYEVYEAICDEAQSEYFLVNTETIDSVKDYALNGMDISLDDMQATIVFYACLASKIYNSATNKDDEFFHVFVKPLKNIEI